MTLTSLEKSELSRINRLAHYMANSGFILSDTCHPTENELELNLLRIEYKSETNRLTRLYEKENVTTEEFCTSIREYLHPIVERIKQLKR